MPKLCIYGGSGGIFSLHFANKISSGNRNPQGDEIEAEERAAAGRRLRPEAVTEQKAGYQTADVFWTKVTHSNAGHRKHADLGGYNDSLNGLRGTYTGHTRPASP